MANEQKNVVVGLDIGTAKVMAVVAELQTTGALKLIGFGRAKSNGLKRGVVVNIDAAVASIQQALQEAESTAGCHIGRVYTGITGSHLRGVNSSGMIPLKEREVTAADVERVLELAKAIPLQEDQRLLLAEPQEFILGGQEVREPIGMSGNRLEASVHIVTGAQSAAENVMKCVRRCGLEIDRMMLNPIASAHAVLTPGEKELGVVMVDIGAGTTDIVVYAGGAIRHTAVIPIAGDLISSDIAMYFRISPQDAEEIKLEHACAKSQLADAERQFDVPTFGSQEAPVLSNQFVLSNVIEPRVEEIFALVQQVIRESGYEDRVPSGMVLTGGSAVMPGIVELAEDILLKPVRLGVPQCEGPLHEMLNQHHAATAIGLLEQARLDHVRAQKTAHQTRAVNKFFDRIKNWFLGSF